MNTADAMKYFDIKEHYLAVRKAWAETCNSDQRHDLRPGHFMFYNLLRGKPATCGFSERTNLWQIYHQGWVNLGVDRAQSDIRRWARYNIDHLLFPFRGMVDESLAHRVVADMPVISQKLVHAGGSFEQWANKYVGKELNRVAQNLIANQKPLDADLAQALYELIETGEAYA
jgi:hypothetical protein